MGCPHMADLSVTTTTVGIVLRGNSLDEQPGP